MGTLRRMIILPVAVVLLAACNATSNQVEDENLLPVIGEIEPVLLVEENILLDARVDTGAETCSLDAREIKSFERDGKGWVRFRVPDPAKKELRTVERPLSRRVKDKRHGEKSSSRPVVKMRGVIGVITFGLMSITLVEHLTFTFPELMLVVLAVILLIGQYTGYRRSELRRFEPQVTSEKK